MKRLISIITIILAISIFAYSQSSEIVSLLDTQENLLLDLDRQFADLQNNFISISAKADVLAKDNKQIQESLDRANLTILELQDNIKQYKDALFSNKDDTAYIITLFADAQNEIEKINKKIIQQEKIIKIQKGIIYIGIPSAVVIGGVVGGVVSYKLFK